MKKSAKTVLSLLLVLTMIMSVCLLPAMAYEVEGSNGLYVFIGDSMSFDFTGKNNYYASVDTYPQQVARALGYSTGYGEGYFAYEPCRLPGGRITDAYTFLSDYPGDDYYMQRFAHDEKQYSNYSQYIEEADVISIQIGYSAISIFLLDNLSAALGGDELKFNADLSQIFTPAEVEKIMPFVSKCSKLVDTLISSEMKSAFSRFMDTLSDAQLEALASIFGEEIVNTVSGAADKVGALTDTITYVLAAHCLHFDRTVDRIREINPDVELYIMGMVSPMEHLNLGFDLLGKTYTLPLGELLSGIFDILNVYMKVLSPYSTDYYFVDNLSHAETFGEVMARDPQLTLDLLYDYYNKKAHENDEIKPEIPYGWDDRRYENTEAYALASAQAEGTSQALANTMVINISKLLADLPSDLSSVSLDTDDTVLAKLTEFDENGKLTASYLDQLMAHIFTFGMLNGIYVHPTQAGHDAEAPLLIAAMQNPQVDPLAIAYHKLMAPMEKTIEALDNSTTIDEFTAWVESIKDIWQSDDPADPGDDDDGDDDQGDPGDEPAAPQPTVLQKIGTVVKNMVKTVTTTVHAIFTKLGSLFR